MTRFLSKVMFILIYNMASHLLQNFASKNSCQNIQCRYPGWGGGLSYERGGDAPSPPPPPPLPGKDNFNGVTEDANALTLLKVAFGPGDSILDLELRN